MNKSLVVCLLILALVLSATSGLAAEKTLQIGETVPFTITDSSLETLVLTLPGNNTFINNEISPGIPNGYQVVINHNDHRVHIGGNAVVVSFKGDSATIKMQGNALKLSIGNKLFKGKELKVIAYFGNHTAVVRG
jgi:hypothetical protein